MINSNFGSLLTENYGTWEEFTEGGQSQVCDVARELPDIPLLKIFEFYLDNSQIEAWHKLVHVCRKWRTVVFGSPRQLDLRLHIRARTPVRRMLDVWPLFPIIIRVSGHEIWGVNNAVAALEHNDRICMIDFCNISSLQSEEILAIMQQPFPTLTRLQLGFEGETAPVIPDSFLGGSAPQLQTLWLDNIPFPGLPRLLSSATDLVALHLYDIPYSGYMLPEAIATCLPVSTRLESLIVRFESPLYPPNQRSRRPPPKTRSLLPALTEWRFKGVSEYLEDLMSRIDAPLLEKLDITFFYQLIFDTPQIAQFISRTPKLKYDEAHVIFSNWDVSVTFPQAFDGVLVLGTSCRQSDWQLSSLAQISNLFFPVPLISAVEHLYILEDAFSQLGWQEDIESGQWLEFLHPFTSVKGLHISQEFLPRIVPALKDPVGEGATEMLPSLQTLFVQPLIPSDPIQEVIGQFIAARQLSGNSISVSYCEIERE